jgi:hypothetical protein
METSWKSRIIFSTHLDTKGIPINDYVSYNEVCYLKQVNYWLA